MKYGKKTADLPAKKVADGANTTYMLVEKDGRVDFKADNYQEIIKQTAEGQILYTISSSAVRNSELKSQSVKDFQAALDEIKNNERKALTSTDIVAYASPDERGYEQQTFRQPFKECRESIQESDQETRG